MFGGGNLLSSQPQTSLFGASSTTATGLFNSQATSNTNLPSGGLFGSRSNTSLGQSSGGTPLFGSVNPINGQQSVFGAGSSQSTGMGSSFSQGLGVSSTGLLTQGKGTVGVKVGSVRDKDNAVFTNILAANAFARVDKSLEELRWEDYQLKKAGQIRFSKNQTTGTIGNTGTSLFTGTQTSSSFFANPQPLTSTATSSGGLFGSGTNLSTGLSTGLGTGLGTGTGTGLGTGLFGSTTLSTGLATSQANKPAGSFGSATTTTGSLFSGATAGGSLGNTGTLFGGGTSSTPSANTTGSLFGSAPRNVGGLFVSNTPNPTPNAITPTLPSNQSFVASVPLLAPAQKDNSDPYYIKSYFTGKKELQQNTLNQKPLTTPYDNIGEMLRRESHVGSNWEFKQAPRSQVNKGTLFVEEEGSSIAKRLQSAKETIAQSIEKFGKLSISSADKSESVISWEAEDEDVITLHIESSVKKKKVKMQLKMHNSRQISELKQLAINKVNAALKLNITLDDSTLIKGDAKLKDNDTIEESNLNTNDRLILIIDNNTSAKSQGSRKLSTRTISLLSEQPKSPKESSLYEEPLDKHNAAMEEVQSKVILNPRMYPKFSRNNYSIKPDLATIHKMTEEELKSVKDFTIENEYGKIIFEGETNIIGLDLDKIIRIEDKRVIVYPEDCDIPHIGEGLNKPAIIHLYNCFPSNKDNQDIQRRLEKTARKQKAIHIDYDNDSGTWTFKVNHF